jgi:hypothetical protein
MANKLFFLATVVAISLGCTPSRLISQSIDESALNYITNDDSLKKELGILLNESNKIDSNEVLKVIFVMKVDSVGEVHSAHIRWAKNFNWISYYDLSRTIESKFRLPYFYKKYKNQFLGDKYVHVRVPFSSR